MVLLKLNKRYKAWQNKRCKMSKAQKNTLHIGKDFENQACAYLQDLGYRFIARNYRAYHPLTAKMLGEIDLIMLDGDTLVFVEVRARKNSAFGGALASIGMAKQYKIAQTAQQFLAQFVPPKDMLMVQCRFDVVAFDTNGVQHITHAFEGY